MKCPHCQSQNPSEARFCADCGKPLAPAKMAEPDFSTMRTADPSLDPPPGPGSAGSGAMLEPGAIFAGRYQVQGEVGRGGMGVVYRAHDQVIGKDVALKLIRADRLSGKDAVKRLIREGAMSRDIRHPNVVSVYDVGEADGQPYLSMEMLEGVSLRAWNQTRMREGADCAMATAARIVREIAAGLGAAHAAGVIHRDLKPENVVLMSEPDASQARLKILDFGIARAAGAVDTGNTSMGTMEYMAPEQMTAPEAVQASADFYSLSVIFYELLVGVVPKGHWQPPSMGRTDTPPAIDKLIERGLSNSQKARPQTAADYLAALDEALGSVKPAPKPEPKPEPRPEPKPRPEPRVVDNDGPKPAPLWQDRRVLLGAAGVIGAIAIVSGLSQMAGSGSSDASDPGSGGYDGGGSEGSGDNGDEDDFIPPSPPPPPPPPPAPEPQGFFYPVLGGYWADDSSNIWAMAVDPSGNIGGAASSGPLVGVSITGQISGTRVNLDFFNSFGTLARARGTFDGGCHIALNLTDVNGAPAGSDTIHVNHSPGDPCP